MSCRATVRIRSAEGATLAAAVAPDDAGSCDIRVEPDGLVVQASAGSPMGLLRTLDDVLACLRAAAPEL